MWRSHSARAFDIDERFGLERLSARHSGEAYPRDETERDQNAADIASQKQREQDENEQVRKTVEDIDDAHQNAVKRAAGVSREKPVERADDERDHGRADADGQRYSRAVEDARENISTELVGAEPMIA